MVSLSTLERRRQARAATPPPIETVDGMLPTRRKRHRLSIASQKPAPVTSTPIAQSSSIDTAPLSMFELSELNVRKSYDQRELEEMARDLELRGQLQNLVAITTDSGKLAVIAGGRRLRAFWMLQEQGKVSADHLIAFMLAPAEDGRETSLAENVTRVALNPVDEITAYAQIVADHADQPDPIAYCASRQGVTRSHVDRMLRLADLPPEILDALRVGRVDIHAAQAYGTTSDRAAQLQVFHAEERREFGIKHVARTIRDNLRGRSYPVSIPQAVYVGLDAYIAAGGRTDRELFFGDDQGERLLDPSLLDQLAVVKATAALPELTKADGLKAGLLTSGFNPIPAWPKPPATHIRSALALAQIPPEIRAETIGVYNLAQDGSGLELAGVMTPVAMPAPARAAAPPVEHSLPEAAPRPTLAPAPIAALPPRRTAETADECMARLRDQAIRRRAATLAARALATTALAFDRVVMDDPDQGFDVFHEPIEVAENGDILVTVQLRLHPDELQAQLVTAAEEVDADPAGGGAEAEQPVSEAA